MSNKRKIEDVVNDENEMEKCEEAEKALEIVINNNNEEDDEEDEEIEKSGDDLMDDEENMNRIAKPKQVARKMIK